MPAPGIVSEISKRERGDNPTHATIPTNRSQLDLTPAGEPDEDELEERRAIQAEACGSEAAQ